MQWERLNSYLTKDYREAKWAHADTPYILSIGKIYINPTWGAHHGKDAEWLNSSTAVEKSVGFLTAKHICNPTALLLECRPRCTERLMQGCSGRLHSLEAGVDWLVIASKHKRFKCQPQWLDVLGIPIRWITFNNRKKRATDYMQHGWAARTRCSVKESRRRA